MTGDGTNAGDGKPASIEMEDSKTHKLEPERGKRRKGINGEGLGEEELTKFTLTCR